MNFNNSKIIFRSVTLNRIRAVLFLRLNYQQSSANSLETKSVTAGLDFCWNLQPPRKMGYHRSAWNWPNVETCLQLQAIEHWEHLVNYSCTDEDLPEIQTVNVRLVDSQVSSWCRRRGLFLKERLTATKPTHHYQKLEFEDLKSRYPSRQTRHRRWLVTSAIEVISFTAHLYPSSALPLFH